MPANRKVRPRRRARRAGAVVVLYSAEVAREICVRIAAESWRSMAGTGRLPSEATGWRWTQRYPVFAEALAQAREVARERRRSGQPLARNLRQSGGYREG